MHAMWPLNCPHNTAADFPQSSDQEGQGGDIFFSYDSATESHTDMSTISSWLPRPALFMGQRLHTRRRDTGVLFKVGYPYSHSMLGAQTRGVKEVRHVTGFNKISPLPSSILS